MLLLFTIIEDTIADLRSNRKYELLEDQTAQGPFKGLMGVAGTRWLSHSGAIARALDILSNVALTLDCTSSCMKSMPLIDLLLGYFETGMPRKIKTIITWIMYLTNSPTFLSNSRVL